MKFIVNYIYGYLVWIRRMRQLQGWAEKNNYQLQVNPVSFSSEGAMAMDSLKGADELHNHVSGTFRNQIFEWLNFRENI
jgi:hypothetical protein